MTEPEVPDAPHDALGSIFGGLNPTTSSSAVPSAYPTRRSLREAAGRDVAAATGADAGFATQSVPGVLHTVEIDADTRLTGEARASRRRIRRAAREVRRLERRSAREVARAAARDDRGATRARFSAAGTMVVIGGLFAALALPAYADPGVVESAPIERADEAQAFAVAESVEAAAVKRDDYGATSAANLRRYYRDQIRQANLNRYLASGALAMGDDYPWPGELHSGQGGGLSPLRYYYRECVDFVAWRLNRDKGFTSAPFPYDWGVMTPGGGSAISWKRQWDAHGWETSSTPQVGWVAWFGGANHVAYVSQVHGDQVLLEEYNWGNDHAYNQRTVSASSITLFLAPPP